MNPFEQAIKNHKLGMIGRDGETPIGMLNDALRGVTPNLDSYYEYRAFFIEFLVGERDIADWAYLSVMISNTDLLCSDRAHVVMDQLLSIYMSKKYSDIDARAFILDMVQKSGYIFSKNELRKEFVVAEHYPALWIDVSYSCVGIPFVYEAMDSLSGKLSLGMFLQCMDVLYARVGEEFLRRSKSWILKYNIADRIEINKWFSRRDLLDYAEEKRNILKYADSVLRNSTRTRLPMA